jgi:hypothetical protein
MILRIQNYFVVTDEQIGNYGDEAVGQIQFEVEIELTRQA